MRGDLTALRLDLAQHGYPPVPVTSPWAKGVESPGKAPKLVAWQKICRDASEAEIASWEVRLPDHGNTGILCGDVVAIDIDILDEELANKIEVHARQRLGDTPLRRVGQAPKRLLVYRTDQPFTKLATGAFFKDGKRCLVEALASGQQFVSSGGHPGGFDYAWTSDTPLQVTASDLPTVSGGQVAAFLDECTTIMRFARAVPDQGGGGALPRATGRPLSAPPVQAWCGVEGNRPPRELVAEALRWVPCGELDYVQWITIGHSLCAALGDDGGDLWVRWSDGYAQNDRATSARKWRSFNTCRSSHRTLFSWAERRGWKGWPSADREGPSVDEAHPGDQPHANGKGESVPAGGMRPLLAPLAAYDPANEPPQIVRGVIGAGQVITMIGGPGCGKTTLACLLAVCVASGTPWMGFETEPGPVVYVSAEAPVAAHKRLTAACMELNLDPAALPIMVMPQALFLDDFDLVSRVIGETQAFLEHVQRPALSLVILDTFARCIAGADENSAEHVGTAVVTIDRLKRELGCAVIPLHHPSKANPTQGRGSSAMPGAVDGEIVIVRETSIADAIGTISPGKPNRDLELFQPVNFRLKPVDLGHDGRGDMVRTVIAVEEGGSAMPMRAPITGQTKIAFDALVAAIAAHGEALPGHPKYPPHVIGVKVENWRAVFYDRYLGENPEQEGNEVDMSTTPKWTSKNEAKMKAFQRGGQKLIAAGHVGISQPFAWLIKKVDTWT